MTEEQPTKTCRMCGQDKPETEFFYRGGGRKGKQVDCRDCSRKRARDYRQSMRDRVAEYKLGKGCEACGFEAKHSCQLDLDHIDPSTKTYKGSHRSYDPGWSWERIQAEIAKCTVLCKNCHALRTYEEKHWKNEITSVRMRQSSAQT